MTGSGPRTILEFFMHDSEDRPKGVLKLEEADDDQE